MKKLLMVLMLFPLLVTEVNGLEIETPAPPEAAMAFMPSSPDNFAEGMMEVLRDALLHFSPAMKEAASVCAGVMAAVLIVSVVQAFPGVGSRAVNLAGSLAVAAVLLETSNSMIHLATGTVEEISQYGKLLLPVMTTSLAAQGGVSASAALYAGTALFDSILSSLIAKVLTPFIYVFLALGVVHSATGEQTLKSLRDTLKGFMTWGLKTVMYVFTGYLSIVGVVSGSTDAAMLKAAKLTISGAVPVVGGILSDASEAVLVSAGTIRNAAGVYGMFAVLAIWLGPFLKIGAQYLLLKGTCAICGAIGSKEINELVKDFSTAMGFLLAMTGSLCLMLMISIVCFLRGTV